MSSVINSFRKFLKRRLARSFPASSSRLFSSPAPGSSSVSGPLFVLCSPPASYPKTRQMSLSVKKFGCQLISYRNINFHFARAKRRNLTLFLPQISNFTLTEAALFFFSPRFSLPPSPHLPPILLEFCYSIGIKNLIRRMQNVRLAMSFAVGICGDSLIYNAD